MSGPKILVIGAGLSGLVAALELERSGYDVLVVEASGRVGGRVRTWAPAGPGGATGELGAMRVPAQHATVLRYVERAGLTSELVPFVSPFASPLGTASGWFSRGGAQVPWSKAEALVSRPTLGRRAMRPLRPETLRFAHRLKAMLDAVAPRELRERFDDELSGALLEALDDLDLTPHLDARHPRVELDPFFARHPDIERHFSATTLLFLRDVALETQTDLYTIRDGMERLPRALAALLRRPVLLGTPARRIERRKEDVLVHLEGRHGIIAQRFDWVVCTVPFSALRHLELVGLGAHKLQAIHEQPYCSAAKALLWCKEPFWHAAGVSERGGASSVDGPIRQIYYPRARQGGEGAVLLAAYVTGGDATALRAMSAHDRWSVVRREAARLHPELDAPGMVQAAVYMDWDDEPWIRGGCSVPWRHDPGEPSGAHASAQLSAQARAAARPEGRLLFAGEHCSVQPAWLEGAARSALDAVERVLESTAEIRL